MWSDRTLKMRFTDLSLDEYWISVKEEYPDTYRKAMNTLVQFSSSYLCEQVFLVRFEVFLLFLLSKHKEQMIDTISFQVKMNFVCAYLKIDSELNICITKQKKKISAGLT
jgi:hypothetical protein